MNLVKILMAVNMCILLGACSVSKTESEAESEARESVRYALRYDPATKPGGKLKFGKFTQVGENFACLGVDTETDIGRQYILLKSGSKWEVSRAPIISHAKCIEEPKKEESVRATARLAAAAREVSKDAELQRAVLKNLKDPESAKIRKIIRFRDFNDGKVEDKACIVVNAKNSYGAYTGDRILLFMELNNGWRYVSDATDGAEWLCVSNIKN